jgi:hypothetical protein
MTYLILFMAGVAQDFLITGWTRAVSRKQKVVASGMAGLVTIVSMLLLANVILVEGDVLFRVLALAAGNVLGTFLVIDGEERLEAWLDG